MKKGFYVMLFLLGIQLSGFLFGCGQQKTTVVQGTVASVNTYEAIASATVQIGNDKVTTGTDGSFSITTKEDVLKKNIEISKSGFVAFSKPLSDYSGAKINIDAFMMPVDTVKEINAAESGGNVISDSKGAKVTFPAMSGITEPLIVEMASFNVSTEDIKAAPGNLTAIDANGKATNLISQGMLSVTVTGKTSGKKYDLKGYGNYVIEIPVTGNVASAPDTIPLWYYDNAAGKWKEEGTATKDGSVYRGTVTHFTVWNTDMACTQYCTISGRIADPNPLTGEMYEIKLMGSGYSKIFTQQDLIFSLLRLPLSTNLTVEVKKNSTQEVWSKNITTPSTDGATLDIGVFPGAGYLPNVYSLKVVRDVSDPTVTLSWANPSKSDFTGVEISYASTTGAGSPDSPVTLAANTVSQQFTNLTPGTLYVFTIRAIYTGGQYSQGLSRSVYINKTGQFLLTINNDLTWTAAANIFVTINGSEALYTGPISVPNGTSVQLEAVLLPPNIANNRFLSWGGDVESAANPVTFVMDSDKIISPWFSFMF